jgi:hypothetical protein
MDIKNSQDMVDSIIKRLELGEPYMQQISNLSIKEIVSVIEMIWENSCGDFYSSIRDEYLKDEYNKKLTNVEYNSNLEIEKVKVCWSSWDKITIELTRNGLIAIYHPEHGSSKKLIDLTWAIVGKFFNL